MWKIPPINLKDLWNLKKNSMDISLVNWLLFEALSNDYKQYSYTNKVEWYDALLQYLEYWRDNHDNKIIEQIANLSNRPLKYSDISLMKVNANYIFNLLFWSNENKSRLLLKKDYNKLLSLFTKDILSKAWKNSKIHRLVKNWLFDDINNLYLQDDPELLSILSQLDYNLGDLLEELLNNKEFNLVYSSQNLSWIDSSLLFKLNSFIKLPLFSKLHWVVSNIDSLVNEARWLFKIKSFSEIVQILSNRLNNDQKIHFNSITDIEDKINYLVNLNISNDLNTLIVSINNEVDQEIIMNHYLNLLINTTLISDESKQLLQDLFELDVVSYEDFVKSIFDNKDCPVKLFWKFMYKKKFNLRQVNQNDWLLSDFNVQSIKDLFNVNSDIKFSIDFIDNKNLQNLYYYMKSDFVKLWDKIIHKSQKITVKYNWEEFVWYYSYNEDLYSNKFRLSKDQNWNELYNDVNWSPIDFDPENIDKIDTTVDFDKESSEKLLAINTFTNKFECLSDKDKAEFEKDYQKEIWDEKTNGYLNSSSEDRNAQEFASEFFNINWDKSLDFVNFEWLNEFIDKNGPIVLFFKLDDIKGNQWWSDWLKITIKKVDKINNTFIAIFNWVEQELGSNEWLEQVLPLNWEVIANRKNLSYWSVFKSKQLDNFSGFYDYINSVEFKSDWKWIKSNSAVWKNLKKDWNNLKNSSWEKIEYIWKKITIAEEKRDFYLSYKIEFKWDNVLVSYEKDNYYKLMDYASFIIFAWDKWLMPLSKDEKELNDINLIKAPDAPQVARWWISVMTIISTFKTIKSNFSKKLEDAEDMRKVRFYKRFMNSASAKVVEWTLWVLSFWLLSEPFADLKMEWDTWLDEKIMSIIKTNRNKLGRDWSVNANIVADKIKEDVFNHKNIHTSNPLKAAWYFLNAIDSGWLYFRKLSPYAWTWSWVLALFWPDHQKKYLTEVKVLISQLEKDPLNWKLIEELSKIEYSYIKRIMCIPSFQAVYWTQIVWTMEWAIGSLNSKDSVNKVNSDASAKVFADVFDDYKWWLKQFRVAAALWNLTALSTKIWDEWDYSNWYMSMLLPIISGFSKFYFTDSHRKTYWNIWYTNGFPLAMYVIDAQWAYKLWKILDFVSKKVWIADSDNFSNGAWWDKIKDSISTWNYYLDQKSSKLEKFLDNFESWWKKHWDKIMPLLNIQDISNKNCAIFSWITDEDTDPETKKILIDYVENKVTKDSSEKFEFNWDFLQDWWLQYPKWLISLSDWLVKKVMLDYNYDWRFSKGEAEYLWWILNDKITSLTTIGTDASFDFMFKKFFVWFKSLTEKNRVEIIKTFSKLGDISDDNRAKNELNRLFEDVFKNSRSYNATIPVAVSKTIKSYINYFVKNKKRFNKNNLWEYDLLNKTFTKESVLLAIDDVRKDEKIQILKATLNVSSNELKNYLLSDLELLLELTNWVNRDSITKVRTLIRALSEYEMGSVLENFKSYPNDIIDLLNSHSDEYLINEIREKILWRQDLNN